jgi:polysaccharide pyruvyl transferase CsaB
MRDKINPPNIVLHGAFGNRNIGDDAILLSVVDGLQSSVPEGRIRVLSENPAQTSGLTGLSSLRGGLKRPLSFLPNIICANQADLYVFGGGGILGDELRSLMLGLLLRAKIVRHHGGRSMIYAVGVDPIHRPQNTRLIQSIAGCVDIITVRDEVSKGFLVEAGVDPARVEVTADPALALQPVDEASTDLLLRSEGVTPEGRPLVGISLTFNISEQEQDMLATAADFLVDQHKAAVLFIPFERHNDLPTATAVSRKMRNESLVLSGEYGPREMKGIVSSLDMLIGMRYHSIVFAAGNCVPVVAISFSPKTNSMMERLGLEDRVLYTGWMARHTGTQEYTLDDLVKVIDNTWRDRESVSGSISARLPNLMALAERSALLASSLLLGSSEAPT